MHPRKGGVPLVCKHCWKTFDETKDTDGINCIRECVLCGLTMRSTHLFNENGDEVHNVTYLSTPF